MTVEKRRGPHAFAITLISSFACAGAAGTGCGGDATHGSEAPDGGPGGGDASDGSDGAATVDQPEGGCTTADCGALECTLSAQCPSGDFCDHQGGGGDAGVCCPAFGCATNCPNGVRKDSSGCATCECAPDPDAAGADSGPDCGTSIVRNDSRCPSSYSLAYECQSCSPAGLACMYPGAGDGTSNGCFATAVLRCVAVDAGVGGCAADAASAAWVAAQ